MKKAVWLLLFLVTGSVGSFAQNSNKPKYARFEFFAGYSREMVNDNSCAGALATSSGSQCIASAGSLVTSTADFFKSTAPNGIELSAKLNLNQYLGLKADFSAHFKKELIVAEDARGISQTLVDARLSQYMAGPELKVGRDKLISPVAYALLGRAHSATTMNTIGVSSRFRPGAFYTNDDALTAAVGGGVDVRVLERASVRYALDYNPTRVSGFSRDFGQTQNNLRTSVGILFR